MTRFESDDNVEEYGPFRTRRSDWIGREAERSTGRQTGSRGQYPGNIARDISDIPGPGWKHPRGIRTEEEWYARPAAQRVCAPRCSPSVEIGLGICGVSAARFGDRIEVISSEARTSARNEGPCIRPEFYRDLSKPYHARLCEWIHRNTPWKAFLHTCGGVRPLLGDFIEAGSTSSTLSRRRRPAWKRGA